jgi:methionine-rich copper-binding protein CopC
MRKQLIPFIAFAFLLFTPTIASAHAGVVGTSPTQDQVLTSMPKEISITFSEELLTIANQEINTLSLNAFDGPPVELGDIKISGTTLSATISEGEYASGVYKVTYRIVSADGHKVSDSFTFSLNAPALISEPIIEDGDGVIPAPIVGAIAILVILGGYLALRASKSKG